MTAQYDPGAGRSDDARARRDTEPLDDDIARAAEQAARMAGATAQDGPSARPADPAAPDELSQYVAAVADGIDELARSLREKNADELMQDLRRFADRNPTLYLAGSVALGFALTRFAKLMPSTAPPRSSRDEAQAPRAAADAATGRPAASARGERGDEGRPQ